MSKKIKDRLAVYKKFGGHCAYCGKEIFLKEMQVDHFYPKALTGYARTRHISLESFENLMPSCRKCNHYKRAYLPEDFRVLMMTLHERIRSQYLNKVAESFGIITVQPFNGVFYFEKQATPTHTPPCTPH